MPVEEGRDVRGDQVTMGAGKHVPNACDEGWDGTRADISCYTSDDAKSTHDERGDRRLQARGEVCREEEKKTSLAPEQTLSNGDPCVPFFF